MLFFEQNSKENGVMKYISSAQAAGLWGISTRRVVQLASQGRIDGAEFTGYSWLIPENAQKPTDVRKKTAKEASGKKPHNIYPFPIDVFHSDEQLDEFSPEEKELYRSSVLEESGNYAESQKCAEALLSSNERNIRLGALFQLVFDCLYQFDYESADRYSVMFLSEYHSRDEHSIEEMILLQSYEMEIGRTSEFLKESDYSDVLSFSADILPTVAVMKLYRETISFTMGGPMPDICTYSMICRQAEELGYFYSAIHLNVALSILCGITNRPDREAEYTKRAVKIAAEHDIVAVVAQMMSFTPDTVEKELCNYPVSFSHRVHAVNKAIRQAREEYATCNHKRYKYFSLSSDDYRLISYCAKNYTNEQIAELFGLSRSGINKRLANLYSRLGVDSKKEMLQNYLDFLYDWNK